MSNCFDTALTLTIKKTFYIKCRTVLIQHICTKADQGKWKFFWLFLSYRFDTVRANVTAKRRVLQHSNCNAHNLVSLSLLNTHISTHAHNH